MKVVIENFGDAYTLIGNNDNKDNLVNNNDYNINGDNENSNIKENINNLNFGLYNNVNIGNKFFEQNKKKLT